MKKDLPPKKGPVVRVKPDVKPNKNKKKNKNKNKNSSFFGSFMKIVKIFILTLFLFMLIGAGAAVAFVWTIVREAPTFDPRHIRVAETSYIYDKNDNELAQLHHEQNRTIISANKLPDHVKKAFIAIEDERFEEHFGVDLTGIIRAAMVNFEQRAIVQGASTITQQLVRNAFLTPEQTLERKLQEAWLAIQAEREYTKNEILEMYLNLVYFGGGAYGIEAAAETYFDKNAAEMSIAEAAMLAGLLNSPNSNNPFMNEERAISRMKTVVRKMHSLNFITSSQAAEAMDTEFEYGEVKTPEYPYPYFVDYVLHHELVNILVSMEEFGNRENAYEAIYTRGLRVYTTLEPKLQKHVEYTLARKDRYPASVSINMEKFRAAFRENGNKMPPNYPAAFIDEENGILQPQSAFVIANPMTGEIRALGGGREYRKHTDEVLRFISKRQPGSSIKPIVSYAPAFELGVLSPGSIVQDTPLTIGNYTPRSWDGRYWGAITVREAIRWSRNIPAVAVLQMITPQVGTDYAEKMGITSFSDDDRGALSVALGGVSGISVLEMAQAFGTLANMGIKKPLHTITHILNSSGKVIYRQEAIAETVLSSRTAYLINDILEDTQRTTFTANKLYIDRPVAAKTGTTNDSRDTYLAAYTPNLVSVFWMGYDFKDMGRIHGGHGITTAITRDIYEIAFEGLEIITFEELRPEGLTSMAICSESGLRPTELCRRAGAIRSDFFDAETAPTAFCTEHVEVEICEASDCLPGNYCPATSIIKEVFFIGERSTNKPPTETCDFHTNQPNKPPVFSAEWNSSLNGVTLSWTSPAGAAAIKEYRIFRSSPGEQRTLIATAKGNSYTDSRNLENDVRYTYSLYSVSNQGVLSDPVITSITTPKAASNPPAAPGLYSPANGQSGLTLTPTLFWNNTGAATYTVEVSGDSSFSNIVYTATIERTVITVGQELAAGSTYWWRVRSTNNTGNSAWSSVRSFSTAAATAEPEPEPDPDPISEPEASDSPLSDSPFFNFHGLRNIFSFLR